MSLRFRVLAVLLAYAVCSILLIFLNKTLLSKMRALRESRSPHSARAPASQSGLAGHSDLHFSVSNNTSASAPAPAPESASVSLIDYDVIQLTFLQCAFIASAVYLILRWIAARRHAAMPRLRFGLYEFVASNLFIAMLLTSNLCLKLIPVSVMPVARSLTFIFVLTLDRVVSKFFPSDGAKPQSLFTARRCLVYALILFGYVGAVEPRPSKSVTSDSTLLIGLACGVLNSLITALTGLSMKVTMRKRSEEASRDAHAPPTNGSDASLAFCYVMNLYATSLGVALFLGYQAFSLLHDVQSGAVAAWFARSASALDAAPWYSVSVSSVCAWLAASVAQANWPLIGLFAASSSTSVLVSALNLAQLELCSPLTVTISNATKSVALTLIAVAYYGEHHASIWYFANFSMLFGTLVYATESRAPRDSDKKTESDSDSDSETKPDDALRIKHSSEEDEEEQDYVVYQDVQVQTDDDLLVAARKAKTLPCANVNFACLLTEARSAEKHIRPRTCMGVRTPASGWKERPRSRVRGSQALCSSGLLKNLQHKKRH